MRILLSGYYGFENFGDEALLAVIVAELRRRYSAATIDVLSNDPPGTARDLDVAATPRANLGAVRRAIDRADVVLSGGGGLFQNTTSLGSLLYYAGIVRTAIRRGRKVMVFAQSVGPLDFWGKQTVRECCRGLGAATVRDERSRELFAPLVPHLQVERTADPVFLMEGDDALDLSSHGLGQSCDPLVVVSARQTPQFEEGATRIAAAVDHLTSAYGARVVFVPLGGVGDAEASTAIIRRCRTSPMLLAPPDLRTTVAIIARAHLMIGIRLHALIVAARFGVPFLAVPYDPKISGLCEDLAYPLAPFWIPGASKPGGAQRAIEAADEAWHRRGELTALLAPSVETMRAGAMRNFVALDQLIAGVPATPGTRREPI